MMKKLTLFNIALGLIILMILIIVSLLLFMKPYHRSVNKIEIKTDSVAPEPKPIFRKDGEVTFMDARNEHALARVDVEIVNDDAGREQGLMYRDSMPEKDGMLFLFSTEEPLNFWMKNTRFSLDIIYINSDHRVVNIAPNAKPYSLDEIPSVKPALYVIEVNAGFAERHGIRQGDKVVF